MYEKIVEIIVHLISELQVNQSIDVETLQDLENQGYTTSEISTAFSWIVDRMQFDENRLFTDEAMAESTSVRILHEAESDVITPEVYGYLLQMRELGLINNAHIETFIERCMMMGFRDFTIEDVQTFVANMIFKSNELETFGNRFTLNGNDTVQ